MYLVTFYRGAQGAEFSQGAVAPWPPHRTAPGTKIVFSVLVFHYFIV